MFVKFKLFLGNLTELQKNLASQFAVPTEEVLPQFVRLARTWQGFQEEMVVLSKLTAATQTLHSFTTCLKKIPLKDMHSKLVSPKKAPKSSSSSDKKASVEVKGFDFECTVVAGDAARRVGQLEYAAFCPVALVTGQGFLEPGTDKIGVLTYAGKSYICSTIERAEQFGKNPKIYIEGVEKIAHENSCFTRLLRLDEQPQNGPPKICKKMINHYRTPVYNMLGLPALTDEAAQTPLHFPPARRSDPNHRWNEWDLRREAVNLARMEKKKTHSAQTAIRGGIHQSLLSLDS
jgi:hypothetical protein